MHLDNSNKLNLERNLRKSKKQNTATAEKWQEYEASEDDSRAIVDPELEYMADRSGMIHGRKGTSETQVLEGYGTTNFGVSAYEKKKLITGNRAAAVAGLVAIPLVWKFRDKFTSRIGVIANYLLLLRESYKN